MVKSFQTAHPYFDNNPPISTNARINTIDTIYRVVHFDAPDTLLFEARQQLTLQKLFFGLYYLMAMSSGKEMLVKKR